MDKCKNHKKSEQVKRFATYINRPEAIPEVKARIENCRITFGEGTRVEKRVLSNGFMFATCVFCHIKKGVPCKNRREGRYQEVPCGEGKVLSYCYPELSEVKHRIQIGLHLDMEMDASGNVMAIFEDFPKHCALGSAATLCTSGARKVEHHAPAPISAPTSMPEPEDSPTGIAATLCTSGARKVDDSPTGIAATFRSPNGGAMKVVPTPVPDMEIVERFLQRYRLPTEMQNVVRENILLRMQNEYLKNKMNESRTPEHEMTNGFYEKVIF